MADPLSPARLLDRHGTTYAGEAGITLRDKPSPLYQLLVLTELLSAPITADIAVAAAREIFHAGWRTPQALLDSTWQQRVDALGRGHYRRYDESAATQLAEGARYLLDNYDGDLRKLRAEADGDTAKLRAGLTGFPRIGETGAHIFCREVQEVWPELQPYFDQRALDTAAHLGLPGTPEAQAATVGPRDTARLAAALIRASRA